MPRQDIIRELKTIAKKHKENLSIAKADLGKLDSILQNIDTLDDATLEIYLTRIRPFFEGAGAYKEFLKVYTLKSPEWWVNMAVLGETNLPEHTLLKNVSKALRKEWKQVHGKNPKQDSVSENSPRVGD